MKTVCAWCGVLIADGEGLTTHGICLRCRMAFRATESISLQSFLDEIEFPVVVVNSALEPVATNLAGKDLLRQQGRELTKTTSLGEIVECEYAQFPEGCGQTVHCTGCVLRRTATTTHLTGEATCMVPAAVNVGTDEVSYFISTTKVGECVIIKFENVPCAVN